MRRSRKNNSFVWILLISFGIIPLCHAEGGSGSSLYDSHGRRDPFVPLVTLTSKQSVGLIGIENIDEIIIEGVVYDPKNGSIVIVNGSVLKEGEESGPVKVIKIRPDGAVFSINGIQGFKPTYQEKKGDKSL